MCSVLQSLDVRKQDIRGILSKIFAEQDAMEDDSSDDDDDDEGEESDGAVAEENDKGASLRNVFACTSMLQFKNPKQV